MNKRRVQKTNEFIPEMSLNNIRPGETRLQRIGMRNTGGLTSGNSICFLTRKGQILPIEIMRSDHIVAPTYKTLIPSRSE